MLTGSIISMTHTVNFWSKVRYFILQSHSELPTWNTPVVIAAAKYLKTMTYGLGWW